VGVFDKTFCNDEDIASFIPGDFAKICPLHQRICQGNDGVLKADGWTLRSAASPPATRGVEPGMVVSLVKGASYQDDLLGIDAVEVLPNTGVVLRRIKHSTNAAGIPLSSLLGQPPNVGSTDLTSVAFVVRTFLPQIAEATRILRERYRLMLDLDLQVPTDMRRAAVLIVVMDILLAMSKNAGMDTDDLKAKYVLYSKQLDAYYKSLDATYGTASEQQQSVIMAMTPLSTVRYPDGAGRVLPAPAQPSIGTWPWLGG
jgi:hypothetical protein